MQPTAEGFAFISWRPEIIYEHEPYKITLFSYLMVKLPIEIAATIN